MIVIIAEKTSQARKIASALSFKKTGTVYKGNLDGRPTVLWAAAGHLVELSPPIEEMDGFSWNDPLTHLNIPRSVPYKVCPDIKGSNGYPDRKPAEHIATLNHYICNADVVIGATDPDREGEVIYRSILEYIKYQGPLERVWLVNGLSREAIIDAFNVRTCASHFDGEYYAGIGRRMADYGSMVLTTTYTFYARKGMLGPNLGIGEKAASTCSVGRVQSTSLGFVYHTHMKRREFESISHFKIKPYFAIDNISQIEGKYLPTISESIIGSQIEGISWKEKDFSSSISTEMSDKEIEQLSQKHPPKPLYVSKRNITEFKERLLSAKITSIDINEYETCVTPPKPLSLTQLQSLLPHASAQDVMAAAQKLYVQGYINYPRSEETELNDKDFNPRKLNTMCNELAKWTQFGQSALALQTLLTSSNASGMYQKPKVYTDSEKSHEALSPVIIPSQGALKGLELEVFGKITEHYLLAHLPPSRYRNQCATISVSAEGMFGEPNSIFELKMKECIHNGWELKRTHRDLPLKLHNLLVDDLTIDSVLISDHQTAPPPLYSEATLLFAMYHAAKHEPDPTLRQALKSAKGIGTTATRPSVIKTLHKRGYIEQSGNGKLKTIDITRKGIDLFNALPREFKSPGTTASWELELENISSLRGDTAAAATNKFIDKQLQNIEKLIKYLNQNLLAKTPKTGVHPNQPLSTKTKEILMKRCKGLGLPTPRHVIHSEAKTREWLKMNPWKVTDAMKRKINQINVLLNITAPRSCSTDFKAAMEFIKKYESQVPSTPAPGSIKYAKQLSNATGLKIPQVALSNAKVLSEFIKQAENVKAIPNSLLQNISQLASQHNVRVSTSELKDIESAKLMLTRLSRL